MFMVMTRPLAVCLQCQRISTGDFSNTLWIFI